jgi:hypothetical protein
LACITSPSPCVRDTIFARVRNWPGVEIEFAPKKTGKGPKVHTMITEPGGTRLTFAFDPRRAA